MKGVHYTGDRSQVDRPGSVKGMNGVVREDHYSTQERGDKLTGQDQLEEFLSKQGSGGKV